MWLVKICSFYVFDKPSEYIFLDKLKKKKPQYDLKLYRSQSTFLIYLLTLLIFLEINKKELSYFVDNDSSSELYA